MTHSPDLRRLADVLEKRAELFDRQLSPFTKGAAIPLLEISHAIRSILEPNETAMCPHGITRGWPCSACDAAPTSTDGERALPKKQFFDWVNHKTPNEEGYEAHLQKPPRYVPTDAQLAELKASEPAPEPDTLVDDKLVAFLKEAARWFRNHETNGEDYAYWANVYNAENCEEAASHITALTAQIEEVTRERDEARGNDERHLKKLKRDADELAKLKEPISKEVHNVTIKLLSEEATHNGNPHLTRNRILRGVELIERLAASLTTEREARVRAETERDEAQRIANENFKTGDAAMKAMKGRCCCVFSADGHAVLEWCKAHGDLRTAAESTIAAQAGEIELLRKGFEVGVWTEAERDGLYEAHNRAHAKHGMYETLFAVAAFILRHRASLTEAPK